MGFYDDRQSANHGYMVVGRVRRRYRASGRIDVLDVNDLGGEYQKGRVHVEKPGRAVVASTVCYVGGLP